MTGRESKEPFRAILNRVVHMQAGNKKLTPRDLAARLGVNYRTFMYWLGGDRMMPAQYVPALCATLNNFELLDYLENEAGRVAFAPPRISKLGKVEEMRAISRLLKEVSEAIDALAMTMENGIVDKRDLDHTVPRLNDVIRECVRIKYWLEARFQADLKGKARSHTAR